MEFLAGMWHSVVKTVWKFNGNIIIFSQKCSTFYLSLLFVDTFPHWNDGSLCPCCFSLYTFQDVKQIPFANSSLRLVITEHYPCVAQTPTLPITYPFLRISLPQDQRNISVFRKIHCCHLLGKPISSKLILSLPLVSLTMGRAASCTHYCYYYVFSFCVFFFFPGCCQIKVYIYIGNKNRPYLEDSFGDIVIYILHVLPQSCPF